MKEGELREMEGMMDREERGMDGWQNVKMATEEQTGGCGGRESIQRKGLTKGANDLRGPEFLVLDHLTPVIADRLGGRASVGEE